jgi:hypothetical protein
MKKKKKERRHKKREEKELGEGRETKKWTLVFFIKGKERRKR